MLHSALSHLQSALDLLDRASAPAHIGAQVDHALHQLGTYLSTPANDVEIMAPGQRAARH